MSAVSTAAETESNDSPLMELRLQCSDGMHIFGHPWTQSTPAGITVYGYAPTETRRMWREGEPCREGTTARGVVRSLVLPVFIGDPPVNVRSKWP